MIAADRRWRNVDFHDGIRYLSKDLFRFCDLILAEYWHLIVWHTTSKEKRILIAWNRTRTRVWYLTISQLWAEEWQISRGGCQGRRWITLPHDTSLTIQNPYLLKLLNVRSSETINEAALSYSTFHNITSTTPQYTYDGVVHVWRNTVTIVSGK